MCSIHEQNHPLQLIFKVVSIKTCVWGSSAIAATACPHLGQIFLCNLLPVFLCSSLPVITLGFARQVHRWSKCCTAVTAATLQPKAPLVVLAGSTDCAVRHDDNCAQYLKKPPLFSFSLSPCKDKMAFCHTMAFCWRPGNPGFWKNCA